MAVKLTPQEEVEALALWYFGAELNIKGEQPLSKNQIAGIVGNLQQESGLDPNAPGGFLAQWIGARRTALDSFAAAKHTSAAGNAHVQLEYIWHELNTTQKGALAALRRTKTPEEAARVFSQQFERPGKPELANREKYAAAFAGKAHLVVAHGPAGQIKGEVEEQGTGWVGELLKGAGKLTVTAVLLLAGAVLVVYGIMVAVRPRETALSLPLPKAVPVPV